MVDPALTALETMSGEKAPNATRLRVVQTILDLKLKLLRVDPRGLPSEQVENNTDEDPAPADPLEAALAAPCH